jgi:hypothetical protein
MIQALEDIRRQGSLDFEWHVIDIDDDDDLEARYGQLIPVLAQHDHIICYYHLNLQALRLSLDA